jgi:hypothetical protein
MEGNVRTKHTVQHWHNGQLWTDAEWQERRVGDDPVQLELTAAIVEAQERGAEQKELDAMLQRKLERARAR